VPPPTRRVFSKSPTPALSFDEVLGFHGTVLKAHRTGQVLKVEAKDNPFGIPIIVKVYHYPTWRDRMRGILRNTIAAPSRVRREADNLHRLARLGVNDDLWLAAGESRSLGFLASSFLITRFIDAPSAGQFLEGTTDSLRRLQFCELLGRFVARLHREGFVDRDLHLRNLLFDEPRKVLIKIDSPRGAFVPSAFLQLARRRDLRDLDRDLQKSARSDERDFVWHHYRTSFLKDHQGLF